MMSKKFVHKAAGDVEPFSHKKLARYLNRIKVPKDRVDTVIDMVEKELGAETHTNQIISMVTAHLCGMDGGETYCARYNLKSNIRKMGPAGHVFEKYIGKLFECDGCQVQVASLVKGECVEHEVDVLARKGKDLHIVECKFHNAEGTRSDVTVALYVYARSLDVAKKLAEPGMTEHVWIATNTKLTTTAFRYAACRGIKLLSIEQPFNNSIMDRVIREGLYPLSTLHMLDNYLVRLFQENYIVIQDILRLDNDQAARLQIPVEAALAAKTLAQKILQQTPTNLMV